MDKTAILILAAGQGKRMGADIPKVAVRTRECPLIEHVLATALALNPERVVVVTGHGSDIVRNAVSDATIRNGWDSDRISYALQAEQRGTGDAARAGLEDLSGFTGTVLILYGDVPLLRAETLQALLALHRERKATLSFITLKGKSLTAYGRIIRDDGGRVQRIVELRDCSAQQRVIDETNSGIYAVDSAFLAPAVEGLKNENVQREYYLTDIVERAASEGQTVTTLTSTDYEEMQGVNTYADLAVVNRALLREQINRLLERGAVIEDPQTLYMDAAVEIEPGARIGPNVIIRGKSRVASGAVIEGSSHISDSVIEKGAVLKFGVRLEGATVQAEAAVGPFAQLRPGSVIGPHAKVGNFVEIKNSNLAEGAKVSHLSYIGDARLGADVNIGAGTITANYDGVNKQKTTIGAGAFTGSNSTLVAPVTIGDNAYVGAGSVITKDVPEGALAVTRAPLKIKPGWSAARKAQHKR